MENDTPKIAFSGQGSVLLVEAGQNLEATRVLASQGLADRGYTPAKVYVWENGVVQVSPTVDNPQQDHYVVFPNGRQLAMTEGNKHTVVKNPPVLVADVLVEAHIVSPICVLDTPDMPVTKSWSELLGPRRKSLDPLPGTRSVQMGGTPFILQTPSSKGGFLGPFGNLPPK